MSASRVVSAEGMDVDEAGVALPTPEWMEAARKAADAQLGRRLERRTAPTVQVLLARHVRAREGRRHVQLCTRYESRR